MGRVPVDWEMANITPVYKEEVQAGQICLHLWECDRENNLECVSEHKKGKKVTESTWAGFMKGKSFLINLIAFYEKVAVCGECGCCIF